MEKKLIEKGNLAKSITAIITLFAMLLGGISVVVTQVIKWQFDEYNVSNEKRLEALEAYTENRIDTLKDDMNRRFDALSEQTASRFVPVEVFIEEFIAQRIGNTAQRIRDNQIDKISEDDFTFVLRWYETLAHPSARVMSDMEVITAYLAEKDRIQTQLALSKTQNN